MVQKVLAHCDSCGQDGKFHSQSGAYFCECGAIYQAPLIITPEMACSNYGANCKNCKLPCLEAGTEVIFTQ